MKDIIVCLDNLCRDEANVWLAAPTGQPVYKQDTQEESKKSKEGIRVEKWAIQNDLVWRMCLFSLVP